MGWKKALALAMAVGLLVTSSDAKGSGSKRTEEAGNELAVEIDDGYLIVAEVSLGELHGLRFLLDTGTSTTAIDRRVAKRLGIAGQQTKVVNFAKTVSVELGEVPEITYGPERAFNVPVLIENLRYLYAGRGPVDGILGLDLLGRKNFLLDYARKSVFFGAIPTSGMRSARLRVDGKLLLLGAELNGRPVWMIADTGILGTVLYERSHMAALQNYRIERPKMGLSLGGMFESRNTIVSQFKLGGQNLERRVQLVSAPDVNLLRDVAGYLGPASLNAKQIVFDFEANQLRWKK
jgi:Aspartyl protease